MKIDPIDKTIMDLLQSDGRASYSSIAEKVGITSTAVAQRIQKMKDEEIILGFHAKLNKAKLGLGMQALLNLKLNFAKMNGFQKTIQSMEEVEFCYRITGDDCLLMKLNLKDTSHLLEFINKITNFGFTKSNIIIEQIV